jgi:UDP-N-acetylmuramoyl-L-alanyl-D-glutamate--2,6-diaminopimelate ligase
LIERLARRGRLAANTSRPSRGPDPAIASIQYDSRLVSTGDVFVARRGQHHDGHDHVAAAATSGAVAVIVEHARSGIDIPQLVVHDARVALGDAAAWREDDPSRTLGIVGITGTDGKTTTAYLVRALMEGLGRRCGLIGTTDVVVGGRSLGNEARTSTPEAPELQRHLAAMRTAGDTWAVVESSSHGLAQERVGGIAYDVAVLTNITSEHLEFHGTLEAYRAAKHSLFERLARGDANPEKGWGKHAVINADDPQGHVAAKLARQAGAAVVGYGRSATRGPALPDGLDLAATGLDESAAGMQVGMRTVDWEGAVDLRLAGRFNVYNALAAMGVAMALGLDLDAAARALGQLRSVPGRMQRVDAGQGFSVVIDYAHTAESLDKVLSELTPSDPDAGLIVVFGSAGDRDSSKREAMGRVAGRHCRLVVLADEDPRSEDPLSILEAIAAGAVAAGKRRDEDLLLIPDRSAAIAAAMTAARPGDTVLLAGKGHEKTIETAAGEIAWDEAAAAQEALRSLA